ncbi:hypothetical protein THAOC_00972, partial [Thalassiosira oceanica]
MPAMPAVPSSKLLTNFHHHGDKEQRGGLVLRGGLDWTCTPSLLRGGQLSDLCVTLGDSQLQASRSGPRPDRTLLPSQHPNGGLTNWSLSVVLPGTCDGAAILAKRPAMEVPRKRAKACPGDDTADGGVAASTAARQQIAELRAELAKCKREHEQVVRDLSRRHDQMVRDQNRAIEWALTVKSIPRGHWLEKGHTGEYAGAMKRLLDRFKRTIRELRTGTVGNRINVRFNLRDEEGHEVTADHDDSLTSYWKELANALVYWSEYHANDKTLEITIDHIETPDAVLDVLRPAIKQSKVKNIAIDGDGTPKPWKLAAFIEDIIQTNHTVTGVVFTGVMLSNKEWGTICNAIRIRHQSATMEIFQVWRCFVDGVNMEVIKKILTSNSAEDNHFNDADAAVLANSLSSNTNLTALHVGQNNITEEGRLAFLRTIFDVSSLASCAASNHNCHVFGLEKDISALNDYEDRHHNKWEKIFAMLALSGDDSFMNTALLRGIPTYLMPKLLDVAGTQEDEGNSKITDLYLELTGTKRRQNHDVWDNLEHSRSESSLGRPGTVSAHSVDLFGPILLQCTVENLPRVLPGEGEPTASSPGRRPPRCPPPRRRPGRTGLAPPALGPGGAGGGTRPRPSPHSSTTGRRTDSDPPLSREASLSVHSVSTRGRGDGVVGHPPPPGGGAEGAASSSPGTASPAVPIDKHR